MWRQFSLGHQDCGGYLWCYKGEYVYASVLLTPEASRWPMEGDGHVSDWFCSISQYVTPTPPSLNCPAISPFVHPFPEACHCTGLWLFFSDNFHSFLSSQDCISVIVLPVTFSTIVKPPNEHPEVKIVPIILQQNVSDTLNEKKNGIEQKFNMKNSCSIQPQFDWDISESSLLIAT